MCSEQLKMTATLQPPRPDIDVMLLHTLISAPCCFHHHQTHQHQHQVESELRKLAQVYAIYSEHTDVVRQYSNMLWSELDISSLMEGVQGVASKLKKLKGLEDMPVVGLVQGEIAGFADSLPLMKELKSEALRWGRALSLLGEPNDGLMMGVLEVPRSSNVVAGSHCTHRARYVRFSLAHYGGCVLLLPSTIRRTNTRPLRPRHWKQLMAATGQTFDLDPKTFTLANMFAMQLHKFKDNIAKVTGCALKELTIENEIKKLAEAWQEQRFDLHQYHSVSVCS